MNDDPSDSRPDFAQETVQGSVEVARWPTEIPLLLLIWIASLAIWLLLFVSIVGIVYGVLIGVVLFLSHVGFIAHVRGSAVRLGPEQLPELYQRVEVLAQRVGLDRVPEAYLMQEGGALNAFATKFLRSHLMVLYSDLLDACGDDESARDMIIGHELGHIKAGHLRWMWLSAPGRLVPFLGAAYSRAREYTCDRYGAAVCGDRAGAVLGLAILAAGGKQARRLNLEAFVAQRKDLDFGWMTLAKWLSGYPALSERIAAIEPQLADQQWHSTKGPLRALLLMGSFVAVPVGAGLMIALLAAPMWQSMKESMLSTSQQPIVEDDEIDSLPVVEDTEAAFAQVARDANLLATLVYQYEATHGTTLDSLDPLYDSWEEERPEIIVPLDPFDGFGYGFSRGDSGFSISSSGPDQSFDTEDDILHYFPVEQPSPEEVQHNP